MTSTMSTTDFSFATPTASPTCIEVTPDRNGYVPYGSCNANYYYYPSFAAAVLFAVAFGLSLTGHIFQAFLYKKWKFCWVVVMGVAWEFTAFTVRSLSTKHQQVATYQIISQILILLAPMWINAFVYMVMGRMIYFFVPDRAIWGVKAEKLAKIFVWLDVLSFLVQLGGGVLINPSNDYKTMMMGIHIYMAGISVQQFFIFMFLALAIRFHIVMHRNSLTRQIIDSKQQNWRWLLYTLYATLALITTRVMYRLAEFSSGVEPEHNPIHRSEAYFMVLDALPVMIACMLLNVVHPGSVLKGEVSEFPKGPSRKEKKEMKRIAKEEKKEAKRMKKEKRQAKKSGKMENDVELGPFGRI